MKSNIERNAPFITLYIALIQRLFSHYGDTLGKSASSKDQLFVHTLETVDLPVKSFMLSLSSVDRLENGDSCLFRIQMHLGDVEIEAGAGGEGYILARGLEFGNNYVRYSGDPDDDDARDAYDEVEGKRVQALHHLLITELLELFWASKGLAADVPNPDFLQMYKDTIKKQDPLTVLFHGAEFQLSYMDGKVFLNNTVL